MKLGFVLTNYRAKLQVEKAILKKKIKNESWFNKLFKNRKLNKKIKETDEMILYITKYIKSLESNNKECLDKIVSDTFISKKQMNLEELKIFINNL